MRAPVFLLAAALLAAPARAQDPPVEPVDPTDIVNALLGGLMGFREMSEAELQQEVAEAGGVGFRSRVPLEYMDRETLGRYLKELFDSEYPRERAAADERTLVAFDLLAPGTDLRALRARLLEENIVGFYDERPGRKRLYAVSRDRTLTPANQIILAHELRHALQDQYMDVHGLLPDTVGDFDDRRVALMSLLEGDATLVMERFLARRLPGIQGQGGDLAGLSLPDASLPDVPPVVRDQLVRPYLDGRDFARALWQGGGWEAVKAAWARPPASSEQVLHPEKYLAHEPPRAVELGYAPPGARLLSEGVLGEMLTRTLLEGADAAGWGGDRFRVWDVSGRTLLVWRSEWDTPADARTFLEAARARYSRSHGPGRPSGGWTLFEKAGWGVALAPRGEGAALVASDDPGALQAALNGVR